MYENYNALGESWYNKIPLIGSMLPGAAEEKTPPRDEEEPEEKTPPRDTPVMTVAVKVPTIPKVVSNIPGMPALPATSTTNYLNWALGGGIVILTSGLAFLMFNRKKKKRS